jgi:glycosyltransferase involved in cell wall biosynthesis
MFTLQKYGGISRYFYELIKEAPSNEVKLGFRLSNNAYLNKNSYDSLYPFFPNFDFYRKQWLYEKINKITSKANIAYGKYDIFHPTYYDPYFLNHINNKPYVVTCYDMIHELFHEKYESLREDKSFLEDKKKVILNAKKVIAISYQTKRDMMSIYGIDGSKIEVIYLGNSLIKTQIGKKLIENPYLLFVGARDNYKNFNSLIINIKDKIIKYKLKLVCAGGGSFKDDETNLINNLGLNNAVINIQFKNDEELAKLYQNAVAFIFPSLYEGFGIPVLEAFACSCPVLLSNCASLPEVGGDAALYFNPNISSSIQETLENILNDSDLRALMVAKGSERLKEFSWQQTHQKTRQLYSELL